MDDLGLSSLADDQLVELARQVGGEIARRSPAVVTAASDAIRAEIDRATNDQSRIWAEKKWLASMVKEACGSGFSLNVWLSQDGRIVRVYLENEGAKLSQKWTYSVTGDRNAPPKSLDVVGKRGAEFADKELVRIVCENAFDLFPGGVRVDCDRAAATEFAIKPYPQRFTDRIEQIGREQAAKAARNEFSAKARDEAFSDVMAMVGTSAQGTPAYRDAISSAETTYAAAMSAYDKEHAQ